MTTPDGGLFKTLGYSDEDRKTMFLLICVPIRIGIAMYLSKFKNFDAIAIVSLVVVMVLAEKMWYEKNEVWWNRKVHALAATIVFVNSAIYKNSNINSVVVLLDVMFGLFTFFYKQK
jgi:hypothetical protein